MKMKDLKAFGVHAITEVVSLPDEIDGIYKGTANRSTRENIEFYYGVIKSMGKDCKSKTQCPNLKIGDIAVFSHFAGYHLKTEDSFCKVVRGYDIVALIKDMENINKNTITPTNARVLVEIIEKEVLNEDGIYSANMPDPREADTQKCRIVSSGPEVKNPLEPGTIVLIDPYCGNLIVNNPDEKLKTIILDDILTTCK